MNDPKQMVLDGELRGGFLGEAVYELLAERDTEIARLREIIAEAPDWGEQYLREMDERKRQGDRAHKWQTRAEAAEALLGRLRSWDVMVCGTGDEPYWRGEIDRVLDVDVASGKLRGLASGER